jgi:hypothetical protein
MNTWIEPIARQSKSRFELWDRLLETVTPNSMAEIGVWRGEFAEHILRSHPVISKYLMIDPWRPLQGWNKPLNVSSDVFEEAYAETVNRTEFASHRREILRGTTQETRSLIPEASLDFAYIDGDHTLRGITIDLVSIYPKITRGGWIGGDDLAANMWMHGTKFEPTLVFPLVAHFAEGVGAELWLLPFQQFLMQKPQDNASKFQLYDLTGDYSVQDLLPQVRFARLLRLQFSALKQVLLRS